MSAHVSPSWASGCSTRHLQFQDERTVVGVAGQHLKFTPAHDLSSSADVQLYPGQKSDFETRHGISLVATCPKARYYAYTEPAVRPAITICTFIASPSSLWPSTSMLAHLSKRCETAAASAGGSVGAKVSSSAFKMLRLPNV